MLMIPATTFIERPDGEPQPGVAMSVVQARELAFTLLLRAEQLRSQSTCMAEPTVHRRRLMAYSSAIPASPAFTTLARRWAFLFSVLFVGAVSAAPAFLRAKT